MLSSGLKTLNELFGENGFMLWVEQHRHLLKDHMYEPTEFLWHEDEKITWDSGRNTFILTIKEDKLKRTFTPT